MGGARSKFQKNHIKYSNSIREEKEGHALHSAGGHVWRLLHIKVACILIYMYKAQLAYLGEFHNAPDGDSCRKAFQYSKNNVWHSIVYLLPTCSRAA